MDIQKIISIIIFLIASILCGLASFTAFRSREKSNRRKGLYYAAFSVLHLCFFIAGIIPFNFFGGYSDAFLWTLFGIGSLSALMIIVIIVLDLINLISRNVQNKRRIKETVERLNKPSQVDFESLKSANPDDLIES